MADKKQEVEVQKIADKVKRELDKASKDKHIRKIEITIDLEAIREGQQSADQIGICSDMVTND